MDPLVSIVMPVYNSQKYLSETITSILNQKYKNIELICVDDGSTDKSLEILEKTAKDDLRVKIITQKNLYAGVARNTGMECATGKYIMFLDSDDLFEKNMLSELVQRAEKYNTDIIFFGFYQFDNNLKKRSAMGIPFSDKRIYSAADLKDTLFRVAQGMPWNKLYNREFVLSTGIKFQNLQSNNDEFFTKTVMLEAKRLLFLNKRYVNYRVSNASSLQGNYKLKSGNFVKSLSAIYDEMINRNHYEMYRAGFERFVIDCFVLTFDKCKTIEEYETVFEFEKDLFDKIGMNKDSEAINNHAASKVFGEILNGDYMSAIEALLNYRKDNFVSKSRIEYRIGCKLLSLLNLKHYN